MSGCRDEREKELGHKLGGVKPRALSGEPEDNVQSKRRGLLNVGGEWALICTAHNLLKYAAACSA